MVSIEKKYFVLASTHILDDLVEELKFWVDIIFGDVPISLPYSQEFFGKYLRTFIPWDLRSHICC